MTLRTDLTTNERRAALVLVSECLAGMGGDRPSDLEHDEYTWVDAKMLMAHGWTAPEANGTFGALTDKGFIFEADRNEMALTTEAWRFLDTIWDDRETKVDRIIQTPAAPATTEEKEIKMFNLTVTSDRGLNFTAIVAAASKAAALRLGRDAAKDAGISRKVGTLHFRAKLAR